MLVLRSILKMKKFTATSTGQNSTTKLKLDANFDITAVQQFHVPY